jgi:hypothetical protein
MTQSFRAIKRDINDVLYSEIIRSANHWRCRRCHLHFGKKLQCCHIFGRAHMNTRFMLSPKPNAVALCSNCHSWFDEHKIDGLIFDERKRVLSLKDESFTWLTSIRYTWDDLLKLYAFSRLPAQHYKFNKKAITIYLKEELKKMGGDHV